jgi:Icc-related predicted phosphoesterase
MEKDHRAKSDEHHAQKGEKGEKAKKPKGHRIAAVGDLHVTIDNRTALASVFEGVDRDADALLLCGDLTDHGTPEEAEVLASALHLLHLPIIAVLGNHDYETGQHSEVRKILAQANVHILDGDAWAANDDLGFAGVKGFAGGFGDHVLQGWGETTLKSFVMEAVNEEMKLESALAKLRTTTKIALTHYAVARGTVVGEPTEIFAFLGTSRLQAPIHRFHTNAVFHGHAHRGTHASATNRDVPVYNVALPLLRRLDPPRTYAVVHV